MLKTLYSRAGERPRLLEGDGDLPKLLGDGAGCVWVDFESPSEDEQRLLGSVFNFHKLAVENCVLQSTHPRLQDYGGYVYLTFHAVRGVLPLGTDELDIFLGRNYLVTYHERPIGPLDEVRKRSLEVAGIMDRGPDRLLAELLDYLVDGYLAQMEKLDRSVSGIEDRLFKHASKAALREIFATKKDILHLRRVVSPQREVLNRLARGEFPVVSAEETVFFRDLYDRIYRVSEMLEAFRDILTSAMEVYLTAVSNRTNEIVKVLTIFSIILMSVSLVTGLYGMNVPLPMQEWKGTSAFYVLLALLAGIAAGLLVAFRKRKWI